MEEVIECSGEDENCTSPFPEQIITIRNGKANVNKDKLSEILSRGKDLEENCKVACICILGEKASGKSFLSNLILQNLRKNGEGNWIGPVTKKVDRLEGFSWNQQDSDNGSVPGLQMMSHPFSLKKDNGEYIELLLMDVISPEDSQSQKILEAFVWLLCPMTVVNQFNNVDLELLKFREDLLQSLETPFSQKIIFAIRDYSPENKLLSFGKASSLKCEKYIENILKSSDKQELSKAWDGIKNKDVYVFSSPGNPTMTDEDGYLTLQTAFVNQIKKFMNDVLDVEDLLCYSSTNKGSIIEYFQKVVAFLNSKFDSLGSLPNRQSNMNGIAELSNGGTREESELGVNSDDGNRSTTEVNEISPEEASNGENGCQANAKMLLDNLNQLNENSSKEKENQYIKNISFDSDKPNPRTDFKKENVVEVQNISAVQSATIHFSEFVNNKHARDQKPINDGCVAMTSADSERNTLGAQVDVCDGTENEKVLQIPIVSESDVQNKCISLGRQEDSHENEDASQSEKQNSALQNILTVVKEEMVNLISFSDDTEKNGMSGIGSSSKTESNIGYYEITHNASINKASSQDIPAKTEEKLEHQELANEIKNKDTVIETKTAENRSNAADSLTLKNSSQNIGHSPVDESGLNSGSRVHITKPEAATVPEKKADPEPEVSFTAGKSVAKDHGVVFTTSMPTQQKGSSQTTEQKQEIDCKMQEDIDKIKRMYMDSMANFVNTEGSTTKEKLQNKHSMYLKEAIGKLELLFNDLKLTENEKQEKLKVFQNGLNREHDKIKKILKKSSKKGKSGRKENQVAEVALVKSVKPKTEDAKVEPSTGTVTGNTQNQTDLAFKERADKLIATYNHNIIAFMQTNGSNENELRNFHNFQLEKCIKHLGEIFKDVDDTVFKNKVRSFQSQLDDEFANYLAIPKEDDQITYTSEEFKKYNKDKNNEIVSMMIKASEHVQNRYDSHMENSFLYGIADMSKLNFAHQQFSKKLGERSFWLPFGDQLDPVLEIPTVFVHFEKVIAKKLEFYKQRLENNLKTAREQKLLEKLNAFCYKEYCTEIYGKVAEEITETGFSSISQLVVPVHEELIQQIIQDYCPDIIYRDAMLSRLRENVKQELQTVLKLETVLKAYKTEVESQFRKEICFSDKLLNDCHEAAKGMSLEHPIIQINCKLLELSKIAIDFAKNWFISQNKEVQKLEAEGAQQAIKVVKDFYNQEMNTATENKIFSTQHVIEIHKALKIQSILAFKKVASFYCTPEISGLEDFSKVLEVELEDLLEVYLDKNEKSMIDAVKILRRIISGAGKNFKERMNKKLSAKSIDPLEFEELFKEEEASIVDHMKKDITTNVPSESVDFHIEIIEREIENDVQDMRTENTEKRKTEMLKIRKDREELLKNESARGCTTPCLCVELNIDTILVGFAQPDGQLQIIGDHENKVIENSISIMNNDEFIMGQVPAEKIMDISKTVHLKDLLSSSNSNEESSEKEIKIREEAIKINLEFFFSLVFTSLKDLAEKQSSEKFSSLVISVPLWFASRHRQVIKGASLVAGFEEVFLINDTSAAALNHFTSKKGENNTNCLVIDASDKSKCNAALYSYSEEIIANIFTFGDGHIENKTSYSFRSWLPFGKGSEEKEIYSTVIKQFKSLNILDATAIILHEGHSSSKVIIDCCSKAIEALGIKGATMSGSHHLGKSLVFKGVCEYSLLLAKNIQSARKSVSEITHYDFVYTEDWSDKSLTLIPKGSRNRFNSNNKINSRFAAEKRLSFFEELSHLNRFHFGRAKYAVKKEDPVELKVSVSQEGIYDVELSVDGMLIEVDTYSVNDEDRSKYSALIEKHFKGDPSVEQLQKARTVLKEIAEDMLQRFEQLTVKTPFLRDEIKKDLEDAIKLSENSSADLQTLELKTKAMEKREKKFPKKV